MFGCPDIGSYYASYRIANETEHDVELRFYEFPLKGQTNFVFAAELDGSGIVIERTLKTYALETNNPGEAFEADSIALIFNNGRVEGHTFNSPAGNSMLTNYERNGDHFTYTITEENYNHANPCDGPCN
ncbi:hypothetical protein AB1A65_03735 [Muricauda sp. ANG21]|uniref:hypothetical protein n=1 Tax=Allomuricauda sp. ANG21 TaxID=3042468 RepID=UPI003453A44D